MAFDIEGARAAGYSDTEIADHLGKARSFDLAGARAEGYSDAEIVSHLSKVEPDGLLKRAAKAVGWNSGRKLKAPELSEADQAGAFTAGVPEAPAPAGERIKLPGSVMDGQPVAVQGELRGRSFADASQSMRKSQDETDALQKDLARPELKAPPLRNSAGDVATGLATGLKTDVSKAGSAAIRTGGKWLNEAAIGNEALRDAGAAIEGAGKNLWDRASVEEVRNQPEFEGTLGRGLYGGARSLEQMIAAMVTAGGNPAGTLAAMVGPLAATETGNALAAGKNLETSIAYGLGQGGLEYVTEKLPMGFLMKNLGKGGFSKLITGFVARELPSEELATLTQDALQKATLEPNKTWAQYLAERPDAALETAIATGVMTAGVGGLHAGVGALEQAQARADDVQAGNAAEASRARALAAWQNRGLMPQTNAPATDERREPSLAADPAPEIPNGDGIVPNPPSAPGTNYADIMAAAAARRSAQPEPISTPEPAPGQSAPDLAQGAEHGQTQTEVLTPAPAADAAPKVFHEVMGHLDAAGVPVTPETEAQVTRELDVLKGLGLDDGEWQKAVRALIVKHITGANNGETGQSPGTADRQGAEIGRLEPDRGLSVAGAAGHSGVSGAERGTGRSDASDDRPGDQQDGSVQRPGETVKALTPTGREVDVQYQLRELSSLVPSHDDAGMANPDFPPELQPRDRSRAASDNQIRDMASKFNPRFLGKSETTDDGAPIIAEDGVVESGNGRTIMLNRIYRDSPEKAQAYRDFLAEQGFDAAGMQAPVLVRVRKTPMQPDERVAFTQDSNKRKQLGMAASEQGAQDAELMTSDVLDKFMPADITAASNRDFVRAFVGKLSGPELADMMDAGGNLSQTGKRRIEAALLTAAYGQPELVQELFESSETDIKSIGDALKTVAGQWAIMRQAAKDGVIDPAMDMTEHLVAAVNIVRRARVEGSAVADLAGQGDILSGNFLDPLTESFLRILYRGQNYSRARAADKVVAGLQEVVKFSSATSAGTDMLGDSLKPSPKQIVDAARSKLDAEESRPASQTSLFNAAGKPTPAAQPQPDRSPGGGAGEAGQARPGSERASSGQQAAQDGEVSANPPAPTKAEKAEAKLQAKRPTKPKKPKAPEVAAKPAADAKPPAEDDAKAKAAADLNDALADLADIFGKGTKLNMMPDQEQKLLPVMTRVMDAAFRLGYFKFKDAARFVLDTIREKIGDQVANQITLDHLQGAYIGMAGRYQDQGASSKREVVDVESLADVTADPVKTDAPANGRMESQGEPPKSEKAAKTAVAFPSDIDPRETTIGLEVDKADAEALDEAIRADIDPANGRPISTPRRRNELKTELENLQGSMAEAEAFLASVPAGPFVGETRDYDDAATAVAGKAPGTWTLQVSDDANLLNPSAPTFCVYFSLGTGQFASGDRMESAADAFASAAKNADAFGIRLAPAPGSATLNAKESTDVSSQPTEPNRQDANDGQPVDAGAVQPEPGRPGSAGSGAVRGAAGGRGRARNGDGVSTDGAATGRKRGDQPIHSADGQFASAADLAGSAERAGSGQPGDGGIPVDLFAADRPGADAAPTGLKEKLAAQVAAQSVPVVAGDLANIAESLPFLLPGQHADVAFAETRFDQPDGLGVLFTNGTGTGKTYSGLGIIKRFERQGRTNVLIAVPSEKIADDWIKSGKNLGLAVTALADVNDAGSGIVVTTYANMGQNPALVTRRWDLVLTDEAHYLSSNKDGDSSLALDKLRLLTFHPRARYAYPSARFPQEYAALSEAMGRKIHDDTMDQEVLAIKAAQAKTSAKWKEVEAIAQAEFDAVQDGQKPRVVMLSATPWAYVKNINYAEGYLFKYEHKRPDESLAYNAPDGYQSFMMQHFGYRMRYNKLTQPEAAVDGALMEIQFNQWLKDQKVLSSRILDVDADYDRKFVTVPDELGGKIDDGLEFLRKAEGGLYYPLLDYVNEVFDYHGRMYLLESIKAQHVVPIVRQHIALGRQVVLFHDWIKGGAPHPFHFPERLDAPLTYQVRDEESNTSREVKTTWNALVAQFNAARPDLLALPLDRLASALTTLTKAFPEALLYNGRVPAKQRIKNVDVFNSDAPDTPRLLIAQSAAAEGWSAHDTTGKFPRVLINIGMPGRPTQAIQIEGRVYRTGQASDAMFRYLTTGADYERFVFASRIAERASTAENLAVGADARDLKDAFINAYLDATDEPPSAADGRGGKAADRANRRTISQWDMARSAYFANQKRNSRNKSQEGADYFATPEPGGLKMVQWAGQRDGETHMEPSAGHGAIARWFNPNSEQILVEPSLALASRLKLVASPRARLVQRDFESLDVGANKADTIVMNPPFGTASRTAIDHMAKAFQHLRDGGRLVALFPEGPAADKKFEAWFYGDSEKKLAPVVNHPTLGAVYRGDTITTSTGWAKSGTVTRRDREGNIFVKVDGQTGETAVAPQAWLTVKPTGLRTQTVQNVPDGHLRATISLPAVTFERAGTSVKTRIVVIDKLKDTAGQSLNQITRDIQAADINELFARLEDMEVPSRPAKPQTLEDIEREAKAKTDAEREARKAEQAKTKAARQATTTAGEESGQVQPDGSPATVEQIVPGENGQADRLLTDAPRVEHVTQKGKSIYGVIAIGLTKDQAKGIDPYTWKKDGGYFIRMAYVDRPGDSPKYSLAAPGDGLPVDVTYQIADRLSTLWQNAPAIRVLPSPLHAPFDAHPDAAGAFYQGAAYLFAANLKDPAHAEFTLLHEAVGHYGLAGVLGGEVAEVMRDIYRTNAGMRQAADSMMTARLAAGQVISVAEATEEVLANVAGEGGLEKLNLLQRLVAAIRTALRRLGFSVDFSRNDLAALLARAKSHVERPAHAWRMAPKESSVYTVQDPAGTMDLFPETLQHVPATNRSNRRPAPGRPDHLDAAAGLPGQPAVALAVRQVPDVPGHYLVRTDLVSVGERALPVEYVRDTVEAARAFAYLTDYAVEHLDVLVTDKNGKPLAFIGAYRGALTQSPVFPGVIAQELVRIEGAAAIWMAHNHPSGVAELSRADETISAHTKDLIESLGVQYRGFFAMARKGNEVAWRNSEYERGTVMRNELAPHRVPVVERRLDDSGERMGEALQPAIAIRLVPEIAGDQPGLVLFDTLNRPTSWVPFDAAGPLLGNGRMLTLARIVSQANASTAVIADPGRTLQVRQWQNVGNALKRLDVTLIDVITYEPGQRGDSQSALPMTNGAPVYSLNPGAGKIDNANRRTALFTALAAMPEFFQQPPAVGKTLPDVASEIDVGYQVKALSPELAADKTNGRAVRAWEIVGPHSANRPAYVFESKAGKVWIDISHFKSGIDGGSKVYGMAAAYAHNTDQVLIGDPYGLSPMAFFRRLENMISSALKYRTTDHLRPHDAQLDPATMFAEEYPDFAQQADGLGIDWKTGNFSHNLTQMLQASYNAAIRFAPEIKHYVYDFDLRGFKDLRSGEYVSRRAFEDISRRLRGEPQARYLGGSATLARAAIFNSLVQGRGAAEWSTVVAQIGDQLSRRGLDRELERLAYSLTSDQTLQSARQKAGLAKIPSSFKDKIRGVFDRLPGKDIWRQEVFDKFHGIQLAEGRNVGNLPFEQSAYVAARFSTGLSSILRGVLLHGAPRWQNDVRLEKIPGSKGLLQILEPVKTDLDDFLGWMVGERAQRLMQEGRENNFTQDEIDALRALGKGRLAEFRQVRDEFAAFKRSVLDVAEKAGLIDGSTRPMWDNLDWIPFYRTMDDENVVGPHNKGGFAGQRSGIKGLKGGTSAINDPLENILMNFTHLIDASLKNNVLRLAIDHAPDAVEKAPHTLAAQLIPMSQLKKTLLKQGVDEALVELIPKDALEGLQKMWSIQVPQGKDVVRLMRDGKAEFYRVEDPLLLRALTSFEALQFPGLNLARSMRRLLTTLTTSTPDFIARNYTRDVVAAMITTRHGFHLGDSVRGLAKSWNETGGFEDMLFAGASFAGGHIDAGDPKEAARNVRRTLRSQGYEVAWHDVVTKTWEAYRSVGDAVENANREAIYEATLEQTGSTTKAAYEAKDVMDFSLRGAHPMVNLLADVIPFLNSRVQGMYRLGRSDPKRALIGGLMLMAFSLLLLAINHDDERYQALPDWEKDTYWHFFVPGMEGHLRIPKPFELGALFGSIPERLMSRLMGDINSKKLMQRVAWNVYEQLKIDPIPQIFKPAGEAAANYDLFGGRPIENAHDLKLPPNQRANSQTSATMRLVADTGQGILNPLNMGPKRLEHVWNGYFGAMGMYALGLSDVAVRAAQGAPARPSLRADDMPLIKSFYRVDPARTTQFKTDLYDMYREVSEIQRGIDQNAADGARDEARQTMQANIDKLRQGGRLSAGADALRLLQKRMDRIYADPAMSPDEKRKRIDDLTERGNQIAAKTTKAVKAAASF